MGEERSIYIVTLESSVDESYIMSLTDDQVKVFKWLEDIGYDFSIIKQDKVITI